MSDQQTTPTTEKSPAPSRRTALGALELSQKAATAYGRPDLAERLERGRIRLTDPAFHVLVVGEFKHGKSSLINGILREKVCPVDDDIATAVPTLVGYADEPAALVVFKPPEDASEHDRDAEPEREMIPVEEITRFVTEASNPENTRRVRQVQIGAPHPLLKAGLVLVDTPGVGGLGSTHTTITVGALPMASAVLFVSDASQELTGPEVEFVNMARSMCPNIVGVMTKVDFYPEWRRMLELDQGHLAEAGIDMPILPVSSTLREAAIEQDNGQLHQESGFPQLIDFLQQQVLSDAERLAVRAAVGDMLSVVGQIEGQFASEQAALADPERAQAVVRQLQAAKEQADRLRSQAAKWQQTLNDGFADLGSDVEHDLRSRLRQLTRDADEAIENIDPADSWDEFEGWLYRQAADNVVRNYTMLHDRAREIAGTVAEHFNLDGNEIALNLAMEFPHDILEEVGDVVEIEMGRGSSMGAGISAIRGSYSGMIMFGVLGRMVGLGVLNPAAIVVGLLLGRKALKDERNRALAMRRNQAKNAHRKYTDELAFEVTKDARDTVRRLQRQLRDFFATRAEELHRSSAEALAKSQDAARFDEASRQRRLRDVEAELGRVRALRDRIATVSRELAGAGTATTPPS
ncbi:MAG: dynamin family protein [Acidimicrobiales bacterium]